MSWELCIRFGQDPDRGYLAGIAHDIAKSLSEEDMRRLAKKDGEPVSKLEQKKPSLLHSRAGAVLLREYFGITDEEILAAVRDHTVGSPYMGPLAKIIYIADKIEPTRKNDPSHKGDAVHRGFKGEFREHENWNSLENLFVAVFKDTVAYLRSQKLDLSEGTVRLLEAIQKKADT
jgi:nicotinate-nucleotide adenylyltransferase